MTGPTDLSRAGQGPGFRYAASIGWLSSLAIDGGLANASWLLNDLGQTTATDPRPAPVAGGGYYFLVRAQNACGFGSFGTASPRLERQTPDTCP